MSKFTKFVEKCDGIAIPFSQSKELGYFRGGGGLSQVAHLMTHERASEGYCFGLCTFVVECDFSADIFLTDYITPEGRGKIRGYQRILSTLPEDSNERYSLVCKLLNDQYHSGYTHDFTEYFPALNFLSMLSDTISLIGLKGSGKHMVCCRLGDEDSECGPSGSIFFDPNFGFAVMKNSNGCRTVLEYCLTTLYDNAYSRCRIATLDKCK